MRTTSSNWTFPTMALAVILAIFTVSCKDDDSTDAAISQDEAADEMAATISTDLVSMSENVGVMADNAEGSSSNARVESCGVSYSMSFDSSYTGVYLSFDNTTSYSYSLACSNGTPSSLDFSFDTEGSRSSVRLSSEGETTASMSATGLDANSTYFTVSGDLERDATLTEKTGAKKTFTTVNSLSLSDFLVNKDTYEIEGGTASYLLSGESSTGGSFEYTASVTFNGDGTATINLDNSAVYEVNLETGQVTEQ